MSAVVGITRPESRATDNTKYRKAAVYEWSSAHRHWVRVAEPELYRSARERRAAMTRHYAASYFGVATEEDHPLLPSVIRRGRVYLEPSRPAPV